MLKAFNEMQKLKDGFMRETTNASFREASMISLRWIHRGAIKPSLGVRDMSFVLKQQLVKAGTFLVRTKDVHC